MGVCVKRTWLSPPPGAQEREDRIDARARQIWDEVSRSAQPDDSRLQAEIERNTPASEAPSTGAIARSGNVGDAQR